jgi:alginate O-acetyltransferase complex protein AlgJ
MSKQPDDFFEGPVQRLLIGVFMLILCLPFSISVVDILNGPDSFRQERTAGTPTLPRNLAGLRKFVGDSKWYFMNRFGLRETLIELHGFLKVEMLGVSSHEKVVLGRDGWLFTGEDQALEAYRGFAPFSSEELDRIAAEFQRREDWLRDRGIAYIVAITPDKQSIYPEFLPDRFRRASTISPFDQVLAHMARNSNIELIDVREQILERKQLARLYHRSDSHWNSLGAYFATSELMRHVRERFPEIDAVPSEIPGARREQGRGGDLSRILGLQSRWDEELFFPEIARADLYEDGEPFTPYTSYDVVAPTRVVIENPSGKLGTVMVLRDSMVVGMMPWLSSYFEKTIYVSTYGLPEETILEDRPRLVIQLAVERKLKDIPLQHEN